MQITDVLPRDAIPSIDDPEFGPGYDGSEADDVVVVDGEPPRGYPIRILIVISSSLYRRIDVYYNQSR